MEESRFVTSGHDGAAAVRRVFPEYDKWNGWLKTFGPDLMERMTA